MTDIAFRTALMWFLITMLCAYYAVELFDIWRRR